MRSWNLSLDLAARFSHFSFAFVALTLAAACSSESPDPGDPAAARGSEALAQADGGDEDGGPRCCPPGEKPACCMDFGGWSASGQCGKVCDGMAVADDPCWQLVKDAHGCDRWSCEGGPTKRVCGAPTGDAGSSP
jgi:hypothetical protein